MRVCQGDHRNPEPATFDLCHVCAGGSAQAQALQHPGIWATLRGTMAEEGVAGLYRGCAPTLLVSFRGFPSIVNMLRMCHTAVCSSNVSIRVLMQLVEYLVLLRVRDGKDVLAPMVSCLLPPS